MHKLNVKNNELVPMVTLLSKMDLKNAKSRARSKTISVFKNALTGLSDSEKELFKQYCELDESGEPKTNEQGSYIPIKGKEKELNDAHAELLNEAVVLEGGTYVHNLDLMPDILANLDMTLSGEEAIVYDRLCDEFDHWNDKEPATEAKVSTKEEA